MKLYLCRKKPDNCFNEWIYFHENIDNLDNFIDEKELTELFVDNCLGKFEIAQLDKVIDNWLSKLGVGGTITIQDTDCYLVSKLFCRGFITLLDFNDYLMSNKCAVSLVEMESMFRHKGLKIIYKKIYNDFLFQIKAERI